MNTLGRVLTGLLFTTTLVLVSAEDAVQSNLAEGVASSQYTDGSDDELSVDKRYSKSGFIGSRGKKIRSAFFGVRGRRTEKTEPSPWADYASQFNGDNGYWDSSVDQQEFLEPRKIKSDYMDDLASAVRQREQLGSLGQYMLKKYDSSAQANVPQKYYAAGNSNPDKRAMKYNQFLGMRGKKLRNTAFLGMRGKKDGDSEQDEPLQHLVEALESRSGSTGSKRAYPANAFVGMRG